ncbi:MAG: hypothetical protein QNJ97_18065 [Myxococcota bacterium]|nr:hypothetical protein [Myxococcota bacterium]
MRVFSIATQAIETQFAKLRDSAARVAKISGPHKDGVPQTDIAAETALRIEAGAATRANIAVIKSEDEALRHLIDIIA